MSDVFDSGPLPADQNFEKVCGGVFGDFEGFTEQYNHDFVKNATFSKIVGGYVPPILPCVNGSGSTVLF